jgi:S2P endopeptidase
VPLSSSSNSHDIWTTYLTGPRQQPSLGWCVGTTSFRTSLHPRLNFTLTPYAEKTTHCCSVPSASGQSSVCFTSVDNPSDRGCVDPVPILTDPTKHERCTNSKPCGSESTCAVPHHEVQLMRLRVQPQVTTNNSTVLLWSGSKQEVFEEG